MSFLVLPDTDAVEEFLPRLTEQEGMRGISHSSGRPWIVGKWEADDCQEFRSRDNVLVLFGSTALDERRVRSELASVHTVGDLERIAGQIDGSYHLVASLRGRVVAHGSVSNTRQFFWARHRGVTVLSDRAILLARLLRAGFQQDSLALHLLAPFGAPWPLSEECLWEGVRALSGTRRIRIERNGAARVERWWTPPEPHLSADEAGPVIAATLERAVRSRCRPGRPIAADLSGGMDSTTLAFLAAEQSRDLKTIHLQPMDVANDDSLWAKKCMTKLPDANHLLIPGESVPPLYSDVDRLDVDAESPASFTRARPHYRHLAELVSREGAKYHLGGVGGDELFLPSVLCLTAIVREHPKEAWRHLRFFKNRYRWTFGQTLTLARSTPSFRTWLANSADQLDFSRSWGDAPEKDWEVTPRMPPWATEHSRASVRQRLIDSAAADPEALAPGPTDHAILRLMQTNGKAIRLNNRLAKAAGVTFEAPFTDDAVIRAALSVKLPDRLGDGSPKVVLAKAMGDRVPYVFERQTKGDSSAELYHGLRCSRPLLAEFCEGTLLGDRGLIDEGSLRETVLGMHADTRPLMPFDATLGLEMWLRTALVEIEQQKESDLVDFG